MQFWNLNLIIMIFFVVFDANYENAATTKKRVSTTKYSNAKSKTTLKIINVSNA